MVHSKGKKWGLQAGPLRHRIGALDKRSLAICYLLIGEYLINGSALYENDMCTGFSDGQLFAVHPCTARQNGEQKFLAMMGMT